MSGKLLCVSAPRSTYRMTAVQFRHIHQEQSRLRLELQWQAQTSKKMTETRPAQTDVLRSTRAAAPSSTNLLFRQHQGGLTWLLGGLPFLPGTCEPWLPEALVKPLLFLKNY